MPSWVQHPETGEMIPRDEYVRPKQQTHHIMPDIEGFVSPIDQSVISSRSQLRAHNNRHGVTNIQDYSSDHFDKKHKERSAELMGTTKKQQQERIAEIYRAFEKHRV
jgi:hypothetical protein